MYKFFFKHRWLKGNKYTVEESDGSNAATHTLSGIAGGKNAMVGMNGVAGLRFIKHED